MNQLSHTLTSLEVSEMVERRHDQVLRDINTVISHFGGDHKSVGTYFIEDEYTDSQGKKRPCFKLTKKGCELYSTRMTGEKGTKFAVEYIERFNDMEEQLKPKLPMNYKEALLFLITAEEEKEQLQLENKILDQRVSELEPKANYVDEVLNSPDLMVTTQIAEDYGMTAIAFNKLLNEYGIQYKINGQWLLYASHKGLGYTKSETTKFKKRDGSDGTNLLTKWTQKGRLFIYETLKTKGILPTMEKTRLTLLESRAN